MNQDKTQQIQQQIQTQDQNQAPYSINGVSYNQQQYYMIMQQQQHPNFYHQNIQQQSPQSMAVMQQMQQQNMPMQNMAMQNMAMQNIPMQNMAMQNMAMQNMAMQNMAMQNMPMQNMQIQQLQSTLLQKDGQISRQDQKIKENEAEIEKLQKKLEEKETELKKIKKDSKSQIDGLNTKLEEKNDEIKNNDQRIIRLQKEKTDIQNNITKELNNKIAVLEKELIQKEDEILSQKSTINRLEQQNQFLNGKQPDIERQFKQSNEQFDAEKKKNQQALKLQREQYEVVIKKLNEDLEQQQQQIEQLSNQQEKEHKSFMDARDEITKLQQRLQNLQKDLKIKDESINNLETRVKDLKFQFEQEQQKLKTSQEMVTQLQEQQGKLNQEYRKYIENLQSNTKPDNKSKQEFEKNLQQLQNGIQNNIQQKQQQMQILEEQKKKEYEDNKIKQKQFQEQRDYQKKQENKLIKEMLMKRTKESLEEFGKLDICYVVDCTKSMEPYIEQARSCVRESLKIIKQQTNRDTIMSSIAFYDMEQKPPGGYHQFTFSNNVQDFEKFITSVPIVGGQDPPEDVKGALQQMIDKLKWMNKFKIAILITDCPCHGKRYHNMVNDCHPQDDIEEMLYRLIDQQIVLIGFNLNQKTIQMYEEFKKIYEKKNASDLFLYVDVAGLSVNQLAEKMAKSLGNASVNATQVKSSGTKTKNPQQQKERPKNKDGAMEALCKQGDFYNFEKTQIQVVDTEFTVLNVTINDQVFAANLKTINNIGRQKDYVITEEGKWQCIRTADPFAFGMMKDVFLMKKKKGGADELYVIKTPLGGQPYKTQEQTVQECRSHLVCQQLMKKFKQDIQDAKDQQKILDFKYPNVIYSDFLILKEKQDRYWIAERFFKGEFVKYNNNYGYINDDITEINKFAQAFSYYTFYISGGNYMVNDVQGVGHYFTDPAINTVRGDFDETDIGEEGIKMFLVNFQSKKSLPFEILQLLNITEE
ncbi:unnamed protein product [Paramecium sonneborni]|uniref:VWFA domain-containing protein n=1 Tax=Paramecium sonneborni TaxID=65129 RepID=A0A8S1JWG7_9CILI|nr:unnamed protein product [Paramecium sonneborni]